MESKKDNFKVWLENLQQNSWNLELIISGFSLFLLFQAQKGIGDLETYMSTSLDIRNFLFKFLLLFLFQILNQSILLFKVNLVFHVFLRGLWIGSIGLRYVSEDINVGSLGYSKKFDAFLQYRLSGKYDEYIDSLEKISSLIFAYTYLLMYYVYSFFIWMFFCFLLGVVIPLVILTGSFTIGTHFSFNPSGGTALFLGIYEIVVSGILAMISLLFFVDFVTSGVLKKIKGFDVIYYPLYRFLGFITLARWIRPILYNFLDNPTGRKFVRFAPLYIILFICSTTFFDSSFLESDKAFPKANGANYRKLKAEFGWMKNGYYISEVNMESSEDVINMAWRNVRIESDFIEKNAMALYLMYSPDAREYEKICSDSSRIYVPDSRSTINFPYLLECIDEHVWVGVDSVRLKTEFEFRLFPHTGEKSFFTYVDLDSIPDGKKQLIVKYGKTERSSIIPFWKKTNQ